MMNMAGYWRAGYGHLFASQFQIWRGVYRPMGGVFYLPLFDVFGLNPAPFHAFYLALLLANVYLVYRFALSLGCAPLVAGLSALMFCYHVGMAILYYGMSNIYDVLCCLFYLAAFNWYVRVRQRGEIPGGRDLAAIFALFLCALNSKEMAVTFPVLLLGYEGIFQGRRRAYVRTAMIAGVLTAIYIYGRALGPEGLASHSAYGPLLSMHRVWMYQMEMLNTFLYFWHPFSRLHVVAFWLTLLYLAFRRTRLELRFCCLFLLVTPLPVEFLVGRSQATLYLPMAAFAVVVASVFVDVAGSAARFLSAEPLFRRLGERRCFAALIAAGVAWWIYANQRIKHVEFEVQMADSGRVTGEVIQQFRELRPHVAAGSHVVFLNDPFQEYDMFFIAELYFNDHSLEIRLNRKTPMTPTEVARANAVFDYVDGTLIQVR